VCRASSTLTLVLVDRRGIVRWYHPGAATEQELSVQSAGASMTKPRQTF
jgi:hypothetical protein